MLGQIVLGAILVVMGAFQMWLRFGSWGKELQTEQEALAERRAKAIAEARADNEAAGDEAGGAPSKNGAKKPARPAMTDRGSKLWNKWTAILGPLGIVFGIGLVIWGIVGQ